MLLVVISQKDQVQTRELAAGHDQGICFSSRQKEKEGGKNELSDVGFWFFPVNPGEFTRMMGSGSRGQIKSFQCRMFSISVSPGSHCWQKCHDYDQKAKQLTLRAQDTVAVNPLGSKCRARPF